MAFGLEKNECSAESLRKAVKMVPKALEPYVVGMYKQTNYIFNVQVLPIRYVSVTKTFMLVFYAVA